MLSNSLRIASSGVSYAPVKEQLAIQKLLRERLAGHQKSNPRYSLRAFAKRVGVHVGALTNVMSGKRNVSRKLAERIVTRLDLDPQERSEILSLFPDKRRNSKSGVNQSEVISPKYLALTAAQFRTMAEWEHFAVLSLLECSDFRSELDWISKRLGMTAARARQVIDRLTELGHIRAASDGTIELTHAGVRTSDDIADLSLKLHHSQGLDLAKESLYRDSVELRDFTAVTMAIDPEKLSVAKERIRKFQDELSDLLESGTSRTEVYRLSMQLFPLSTLRPQAEGDLK